MENKAINIAVKYSFKSLSGKEERNSLSLFIMAPGSDEIWEEASAFNRGKKTAVQAILNLAYWHFLGQNGADIEAHLLPDVPFKFDRKTKDAVITLQDGCSLKVWIDVDISR